MSGEDDRKRRKRRFGEEDEGKGSSGSGSGSAGATPMKDEDEDDTDNKSSTKEEEDDSSTTRPTKRLTREEDAKSRLDSLHATANIAANDLKSSLVDVPITADYELTLFRMIYEYTHMAADTARLSSSYNAGFESMIVIDKPWVYHMQGDGIYFADNKHDLRVVLFDQKTGHVDIKWNTPHWRGHAWASMTIVPRIPDSKDNADWHFLNYFKSPVKIPDLQDGRYRGDPLFMRNDQLILVHRHTHHEEGSPDPYSVSVNEILPAFHKTFVLPYHQSNHTFGKDIGISEDGSLIWIRNEFESVENEDVREYYFEVYDRITGKRVFRHQMDDGSYLVIGVIPKTRHLVIFYSSRADPSFHIFDLDSSKKIRTIRYSLEIVQKLNGIYLSDDYRLTKKGIWTVNSTMTQAYASDKRVTNDYADAPHLDFIEFPVNDNDPITTIHTRPIAEGLSRLYVMPDGESVCVFNVHKQTGDLDVFVAHPRSTVYTKSKKC